MRSNSIGCDDRPCTGWAPGASRPGAPRGAGRNSMSAEQAGAFPGESSEVIVVERDGSRIWQPRDQVSRETSATAPPDEDTAPDGVRLVADITSLMSSHSDRPATGASKVDVSRETSLD